MSLACLILKISREGFFAPPPQPLSPKENQFSQSLGEIGLSTVKLDSPGQ